MRRRGEVEPNAPKKKEEKGLARKKEWRRKKENVGSEMSLTHIRTYVHILCVQECLLIWGPTAHIRFFARIVIRVSFFLSIFPAQKSIFLCFSFLSFFSSDNQHCSTCFPVIPTPPSSYYPCRDVQRSKPNQKNIRNIFLFG